MTANIQDAKSDQLMKSTALCRIEHMTSQINNLFPEGLAHERVLNARQAAELFGVSLATFRRLTRAGKLPAPIQLSERRLGWRVRDLLAHIEKCANLEGQQDRPI